MNPQFEAFAHFRTMHRIVLLMFCAVVLSLGAACGDEEKKDDFSTVEPATITVSPSSIYFDLVNIGDTEQQVLTITNTGTGVLRVHKVDLINQEPANANSFKKVGDWTVPELKPNEEFELTVEYAPFSEVTSSGLIRIESNDPDNRIVEIPINSALLQPQIFTPPLLNFERVGPGTTDTRIIHIQNIGRVTLNMEDIVLTGHHSFKITFPDPESLETPANDTVDQWPTSLEPGESFPVRIHFTPEDTEPAAAQLFLYSNDPKDPKYEVTIAGNSGAPCIQVTDESGINFGSSYIGRTSRRTLTIENCSGGSDLIITSIELNNDGNGKFKIPVEQLPAEMASGQISIRPREAANFVLTYDPDQEVEDIGELLIRNNDPSKMQLRIPVEGKGSLTACPTAVAEARVKGTSEYSQVVNARPLQDIEFSGLQSTGDSALTYEWTVLSRPPGSQSRILPSSTIPEPNLWLDLAGDYQVELVVRDAEGLASCESSIVTIHVVPGADIHIQLTWYAKAVPNPIETRGTDLDLHYLHPLGQDWNDNQYDVYWRNKHQNWGTAGEPSMATLDIDDQWGVTTENVNHKNPLNLTYKVGVHYFQDNGFGDADATVRIYISGQLAAEFRDQTLKHRYFWDVATIKWPSGDITPQNNVACSGTFRGFGNEQCP